MRVFGEVFTIEQFFEKHWRQRPLFIKGGAAEFLGRGWTIADFDRSYEAVVASPESEASIRERPNDVTFIERVSAINDDLAARMDRFAGLFGTPPPWCDTIRTYRPSGIGSHFDHSDNFVLQQEGVKRWRLASPDNIPHDQYVARMMGQSGVGHQELPDSDVFEVDLEPGDLLYIPLMWLHSGVSEHNSLSLSIVCPTVTVHSAIVPMIARLLRAQNVGHQVLDAVPNWLPEQELADARIRLRAVTAALTARMANDATLDQLEKLQAATCFPGLVDQVN